MTRKPLSRHPPRKYAVGKGRPPKETQFKPGARSAARESGQSNCCGVPLGPQSGDGACACPLLRTHGIARRAVGQTFVPVLPVHPSALPGQREPDGCRRGARAGRRHPLDDRTECAVGRRVRCHGRCRAVKAPHPDHGIHGRPAAHRRYLADARGAGNGGSRHQLGSRPRTLCRPCQALGRDFRQAPPDARRQRKGLRRATRRSTYAGSRTRSDRRSGTTGSCSTTRSA